VLVWFDFYFKNQLNQSKPHTFFILRLRSHLTAKPNQTAPRGKGLYSHGVAMATTKEKKNLNNEHSIIL